MANCVHLPVARGWEKKGTPPNFQRKEGETVAGRKGKEVNGKPFFFDSGRRGGKKLPITITGTVFNAEQERRKPAIWEKKRKDGRGRFPYQDVEEEKKRREKRTDT